MPLRVISLLPAATEIVCALGLQDLLIGRSHECDFPKSVQHLPVCSFSDVDDKASSVEIDTRVKDSLTKALSIYSIDEKLIKDLAPDVVLTQDQCKVCAVDRGEVEQRLTSVLKKDVEIISLSPCSLKDILGDIQTLGEKLKASERAEALLEDLVERIDIIRHKLKFMENKPRVACIEWLSPLMTAGNWTPELIEIAGGQPVLFTNEQHSSYIQADELLSQDPDIIIVAACGFSISRTLQEIDLLRNLPVWPELKAVKNNQVFIADGNHYFNRSGPRIVDTIEIIAEIINPKQFVFGYEGEGWLRFSFS